MRTLQIPPPSHAPAITLGPLLRRARREACLTQAELAVRAGLNRQKLVELEQGKPGVAIATYAVALAALGLEMTVQPKRVRLVDYPQLKRLAWNRPGDDEVSEQDALALYERNWNLVDQESMTAAERGLLQRLVDQYGGGVLHV
ncbi:hypothetical protein GCM10027214_12710 [Stenotrophomonas tumulicola]